MGAKPDVSRGRTHPDRCALRTARLRPIWTPLAFARKSVHPPPAPRRRLGSTAGRSRLGRFFTAAAGRRGKPHRHIWLHGPKLRGEQLRGLMAPLVLAVAIKLGIDLVVPPTDIYDVVMSPGG